MSDLNSFITAVNLRIKQRDGSGLARLLKLPSNASKITTEMRTLSSGISASLPAVISSCESRITVNGLGTAVGNRLCALHAIISSNQIDAFNSIRTCYNAFFESFRNNADAGWLIPVLKTISSDFSLIAMKVIETVIKNTLLAP